MSRSRYWSSARTVSSVEGMVAVRSALSSPSVTPAGTASSRYLSRSPPVKLCVLVPSVKVTGPDRVTVVA